MPLRYRPLLRNFTVALFGLLIAATPAIAQQQINRAVDVNGVIREYLVYLPVNFDPAENMPVLFAFHGGDGTPQEFLQFEADFRPLADQERFIAAYPAAQVDSDGCRCWNSVGPFDNGIDDIGFAEAMIDAMVTDYSANPNRMYACGFSLGGSLMWDYACFLGDRFAAIGVVAANMWEWTYNSCAPAAPTGIVHILGTNDFYAPYNGNQYSIPVSVQNDYWVSVNGSAATPTETPLGGNVTQFLWAEGTGCHTVEHYRIQGGGHLWPSFSNQTIWDFVSQYDLIGGTLGSAGGSCSEPQFRRGDVNSDGNFDISDPVAVLGYLFLGGQVTCENASDSNDDGAIDLADAIQLLGYLFSSVNPPPAPFPDCGTDSTTSSLDCQSYGGC